MKVREAYILYKTPKNLQEHLLRVAALADILLDAWTGQYLNRDAIVKACALHDIAKPLSLDISKQREFGMMMQ